MKKDRQNDYYGTGSTTPPKDHGGVIAVLLVLAILLCGAGSILGLLGISLFRISPEYDAPVIAMASRPSESAHTPSVPVPSSEDSGENTLFALHGIRDGVPVSGTAAVLTADGYLLTGGGAVENAEDITVLLGDTRYSATVTGIDPFSDLAVLHIQAEGLTPARFASGDGCDVGDTVRSVSGKAVRIGHLFRKETLTLSSDLSLPLLYTVGATGDLLLNEAGDLIGVCSRTLAGETDRAVAGTAARDIAFQLLNRGYVPGAPTLGAQCSSLTDVQRAYAHLPKGVYVADRAFSDQLQTGDVITELDGTPVENTAQLAAQLYPHLGHTVSARICRGGAYKTLHLPVSSR